jgi:hypothetical protein
MRMENPGSWFVIRAHRTGIVGVDVWVGPEGLGRFMLMAFSCEEDECELEVSC